MGSGVGRLADIKFLLDSNVVIGIDNGFVPARTLLERHAANVDACAISQITRIEVLGFGGLTATEEARVAQLIGALGVILFDERIETETIALRRRSRLKLPDAIIVATARVHGLKLLTLDERLAAVVAGL
jgi:predicted nucleic acid-binding protein